MRFDFFPLRFEFIAQESVHFPLDKAANILRGAFGVAFRRIACTPECQDESTCLRRAECAYAKIFAPISHGEGPSGLADSPRPFVFRARHLDGATIPPGRPFQFDLNVFALDTGVLSCFVNAFAALAREGLGQNRGKAELRCVKRVAAAEAPEQILYDGLSKTMTDSPVPVSLSLDPTPSAPTKIRVEFLTPTELKHDQRMAERPEFPILFGRLRDRISNLRRLYGQGALDIDFRKMASKAAAIKMTRCEGRRVEMVRRSGRTGQTHSIGGFVGVAEYEGPLAEFMPYLEAGRWTGVGRQSVWGKGEFSVDSPSE